MSSRLPIGVFDSGLGGLTVAREIVKILPNEDIVYLGDTARVPYGTRSKRTVTQFALEDAKFLLNKKVKCIVIACNTASALSGKAVRNKFEVKVFEVITPASREAAKLSKSGRIGVIGTRATISSSAYKKELLKNKSNLKIIEVACPLFVPFIEEAETKGELIEKLIKKYLKEIKNKKVDTLIMGCTHYPIIRNLIQKEVGKSVTLINPGSAVAKELNRYLVKNGLKNSHNRLGKREYFVTDLTERFTKVAEMFLGDEIKDKIKQVSLD